MLGTLSHPHLSSWNYGDGRLLRWNNGQIPLPSSTEKQRKTRDLNGGKEGRKGNTSTWSSPWVEAILAARIPRSVKPTLSSEGSLGSAGRKAQVEELWQEFFLEPTEWTDHRLGKASQRFPDFKHRKHPKKALWLDSKFIPPWVEAKLVALSPGSTQLSTFSWNELLSTCAQSGQYGQTVELFQQMQRDGATANKLTFITLLKACSSSGLLEHGRRIHTIMQPGFEADVFLGTCLVDMYSKCGSIEDAEMVFNQMPTRNVVTFNAMIGGYAKCGEGQKALQLFEKMQGQGVDPDPVTFVVVLNACANLTAIERGRCAHEEIIRRAFEGDIFIGTCLVDMYAKCGSIAEAEKVFNQMPTRNVKTFSAMIGGYVKCGEGQKALELFKQMQRQGVDPDHVTFAGILNACASVAAIEGGRRMHKEIISRGYESNVLIRTCLVDMYTKCGSLEEAEMVFKQMPTRDVVT